MSTNKSFSDSSVGRYSLALYELAEEDGSIKDVESQSLSFLDLIKKSKEVDYFIKNPTNDKLSQQKIILEIGNKFALNTLFVKFLNFLIEKRRFYFVEKILNNFLEICSKKRGEIKAQLVLAKNISQAEIEDIEKNLIKSFDSKIKLNFKNDPSLIGGLIIKVGSIMIDTSIKNRLKKIETQMLEA